MNFSEAFVDWVVAHVDPNGGLPETERRLLESRAAREVMGVLRSATSVTNLPDALDEAAEKLGAPGLGPTLRVERTRTTESVVMPGSSERFGRMIG